MTHFKSITRLTLLVACGLILLVVCGLIIWQPWTYLHGQHISQDVGAKPAELVPTDKQPTITSSANAPPRPIQDDTVLKESSDPLLDELLEGTITEVMSRERREISGTIFEPISHTWWDDFFTKLETIESEDEFEQMDESMMEDMLRPAAGTVVTVQSASFSAQTTTDAEGRFRFINLPPGSYTLSYPYLSRSRTGQERAIIDKRNVQFNRRGGADFELYSDGITVRGRIIDAYGQPIAGAKVIGTKPSWHRIREIDSAEVTYPVPFTAISRADGTYELQGIDPPNRQFVDVSCYLLEGIVPDTGFLLDINVEADGFADNDVLQVPLVTEGLLCRGRRFLKTYFKFCQGSGLEEPKEKEQLPYPLPSSHGNTITGIDIVLERTGTDVQVEEEGLADNSEVTEQVLQGRYEVSGTVYEPVPHTWWDDFFTKLETAGSPEESMQILLSVENRPERPAAGTVVTVQSGSFSAQTTTDAKGRFGFSRLPAGYYTLSYSYLSHSKTGQERATIEKRNVQFNRHGGAYLALRSDGITVRGRIIDAYGQPIAGAKVIGTKRIREIDGPRICPAPSTAISRADGTYELQGIDPPKSLFFDVSAYLVGSAPTTDFLLDIDVEVDGSEEKNVLQVPLVTEELLYQGRRFLEAHSKLLQRFGRDEGHNKEKEKLPYPLPSSHGNVITAPDIVID